MTGAHSCFVVVVVDLAFALDLALDDEHHSILIYISLVLQLFGFCINGMAIALHINWFTKGIHPDKLKAVPLS